MRELVAIVRRTVGVAGRLQGVEAGADSSIADSVDVDRRPALSSLVTSSVKDC
jgi:hypothetical protein